MTRQPELPCVLVTGASGFVGGYVVSELLQRGYHPVCLARDPDKLADRLGETASCTTVVQGTLFDEAALARAIQQSNAVIHLVGIIRETGADQSFSRIHVEGTRRVIDAARGAGLRRFVHMSALGAGPDANSPYHKSKFAAEKYVRSSGLDWTLFRPSLIHGPEAEFMRLMKAFCRPGFGLLSVPLWLGMPYFGSGMSRLQPVSAKDVAFCFVAALEKHETIGQTVEVGGPKPYTWRELYAVCSSRIAGRVRRQIGVPLFLARVAAATVVKTPLVPPLLKFDSGQVRMAAEDNVCGTEAVERIFGIKLRDFEAELAQYADRIG